MSKQDQLGKNETFCVKWGQNTYLALSSWAWSWSRNAGGHAWSHLLQILHHASSSPPPASVPSPACSSFSPIKHTSYITYILEWTFLYWSFRLWDVIRDFSRLFCSDIRAKSESNFICQIWQSDNQGDEGKCIIPATLNYPRWRKKIPWTVWSQLVCNECFEPLTEGTVLVGPHYFKLTLHKSLRCLTKICYLILTEKVGYLDKLR